MKKTLFTLFAMAAMGSLAISCQKEELEPSDSVNTGGQQEEVTTGEGISFTAGFEPTAPADDDSKVVLSGKKVNWVEGDYISFFVDGKGNAGKNGTNISGYDFRLGYRYAAKASGPVVGFDPAQTTVPTASMYYAICPHMSDGEGNKGLIHGWLSQYQMGVKDDFSVRRNNVLTKTHIAVAKTADPNTPLIFKNVVSVMRFTIPSSLDGQVVRIRMSSPMKEVLSGDMCVDASKDEPEIGFFGKKFASAGVELQGASMQSHVNLYPGEPTNGNDVVDMNTTFKAGEYSLTVAPGTFYNGFDVEFMTKDGKTYSRSARKPMWTLKRNTIYNMGEIKLPSTVKSTASGDGVTALPYIFSFFHAGEANETPKYITYTKATSTTAAAVSGCPFTGSKAEISAVVAVANKASLDNSGSSLKINATYSTAEPTSFNTNCWAEKLSRDNINAAGMSVNSQYGSGLTYESGFFYTFPMKMDLPQNFRFTFGLSAAGTWACKKFGIYYTSDENGYWCLAGTVEIPNARVSGANYYYYNLDVRNNTIPVPSGNNLYVKVVPMGTAVIGGGSSAGVGNSSQAISMHSSFVIAPIETGNTPTPSGDILFWQPFDELTTGAPIYYNGVSNRERLASISNLPGDAFASWPASQKKAKVGSATGEFTATEVYARPGFAQISSAPSDVVTVNGITNKTGALTTPKLGYAGKIRVKYDVMRYGNAAYDRYADKNSASNDIKSNESFTYWLGVIGGGKIISATANGSACQIDINDDSYIAAYPNHTSWIKYSIGSFRDKWCPMDIVIEGATANTQIVILGHPKSNNATNWFTRHFVDNILITKE